MSDLAINEIKYFLVFYVGLTVQVFSIAIAVPVIQMCIAIVRLVHTSQLAPPFSPQEISHNVGSVSLTSSPLSKQHLHIINYSLSLSSSL